jgi:hypothetical protein
MTNVTITDEQLQTLLAAARGGGVAAGGSTGGVDTARGAKPLCPSVDMETTESEWGLFLDSWSRYKRMTNLTDATVVRDNLRQCCAPSLNKRLFDVHTGAVLDAASETELLSWIKGLAVKGVHKEVHRTQFVNVRQKQGELVNAFYGNLKSKASLCDFRVKAPSTCGDNACTCVNHGVYVSFQDEMVATQLVAGLYNNDHQLKVLSESGALPTLDSKVKRLLVLESSDASLSSLSGGEAFSNVSSMRKGSGKTSKQWRKERNERRTDGWKAADKAAGETMPLCQECKQKHPQCPTCHGYHKCTTKCNLCQKLGHIKNYCPKFSSLVSTVGLESTGAANNGSGGGENDGENGVVFAYGYHVTVGKPC